MDKRGVKGILFSSAELTARFGHSVHPLNIHSCLMSFSEVDTCSYTRIVPFYPLNLTLYLYSAFLKINTKLDYVWIRGFASILLKKSKKKKITSICELYAPIIEQAKLYNSNNFVSKIFRLFLEKDEFLSLLYADILRVHNAKLKKFFIDKYEQRIPNISEKMRIIPIPIDTYKYKTKENFDFEKPSIVYVGGSAKWQGLEYLIKSLSMLNSTNATLTLYTNIIPEDIKNGIQKEKEKDKIHQNFLPHEDLIKVLPTYDIFAIPRPSNIVTETTTPIKLMEAMACGMPIVATDVGGINEFVKHKEHGYLVEPGNSEALAEGVMEVIENPKLARKMGENARKFAEEKFDYKVVSKQIKDVIENKRSKSNWI